MLALFILKANVKQQNKGKEALTKALHMPALSPWILSVKKSMQDVVIAALCTILLIAWIQICYRSSS